MDICFYLCKKCRHSVRHSIWDITVGQSICLQVHVYRMKKVTVNVPNMGQKQAVQGWNMQYLNHKKPYSKIEYHTQPPIPLHTNNNNNNKNKLHQLKLFCFASMDYIQKGKTFLYTRKNLQKLSRHSVHISAGCMRDVQATGAPLLQKSCSV